MHTQSSNNARLHFLLQKMYQHNQREFIPLASGRDLDIKLLKCYGQRRLPNESDNDHRDRLTKAPVVERDEIHEVLGYDS